MSATPSTNRQPDIREALDRLLDALKSIQEAQWRTLRSEHPDLAASIAQEASVREAGSTVRDALREVHEEAIGGPASEEVRRALADAQASTRGDVEQALAEYRRLLRATIRSTTRASRYRALGFWGGTASAMDPFGGLVARDMREMIDGMHRDVAASLRTREMHEGVRQAADALRDVGA